MSIQKEKNVKNVLKKKKNERINIDLKPWSDLATKQQEKTFFKKKCKFPHITQTTLLIVNGTGWEASFEFRLLISIGCWICVSKSFAAKVFLYTIYIYKCVGYAVNV